ncbi:hypothetical protein A3C23_02020 [Candidatus Roizmanbacteria bacterium RIFCSPHIGHO2_02_FULL_37_13b]|uniref:Uncharacterized protein n=1 Tax=Candidatus Roizmanbacteria bacterium RIFCSPLOWO2_02_FULL_36_11 TaxID=1802071 RepID=A0A1F7JBP1_9BACT|nr:MAG: hypothetical protein A3C23_02020 [Candidatus Roizmanbacteria bacterium RIFCSPHIGHO2_02_FULL_37_13b]OGK53026.1 MAG: hypothetical protein A3H78_02340 [Candidatus Roizmanbacteria bacterium RIFCSPLOWO2_02_FULL_36_11]
MNGSLICARYSFAPNFFEYCGPDKNKQLKSHLDVGVSDFQLTSILSHFTTLYSYLKSIAHSNNIVDPFDERVVEAYWIGNSLLENMREKQIYNELKEGQKLKKKIPKRYLKWLWPKIDKKARLHHSFHVFNVFVRTGHQHIPHTVETMNQCRIGWGEVLQVKSNYLTLKSQRLIYHDGALQIKDNIKLSIQKAFKGPVIKKNDRVSYHWGFFCDKISKNQARNLEYYTKFHLNLANETL